MKCFTRFAKECKKKNGAYFFDRGWWTYRQISMKLLKALLGVTACVALTVPASVTPSFANPLGTFNPADVNQYMDYARMEGGANYKHNTDSLEYKRYQQNVKEDYQRYERSKEASQNPNRENQIIRNFFYP